MDTRASAAPAISSTELFRGWSGEFTRQGPMERTAWIITIAWTGLCYRGFTVPGGGSPRTRRPKGPEISAKTISRLI